MKITIKATKIKITPEIKAYTQKKLDMLEKFLSKRQILNCDVELGLAVGGQQSGEIYRAEVNLFLSGDMIRVEKTEKDLFKAIDKVKDHLAMVIKKHKEKIIDKKRKAARKE